MQTTRSLLLLISLIALQGCLKIPAPSFELTHQAMLEKTIKEVDVARPVSKKVRPGARVALIPVANKEMRTRDFYLLEDIFTQQLVNAGYIVTQKPDSITLKSAGDTLETPSAVTVEGFVTNVDQGGQPIIQKIEPNNAVNVGVTEWDHIKALLPNIDAFIVYNVHELGKLLQRRTDVPKMISREFRLKMTIRVIKADDMRILSVEEVNSFKRDDLHVATLNALEEYDYNSSNYTYPLLQDKPSSRDSHWLSAASTDWDFSIQLGTWGTNLVNEPTKYLWFRGGFEANFGRLTVGLMPAKYDIEVEQTGKNQVTNRPEEKNLVIQYSKKVGRLGDKGALYLGGGLTKYSEDSIKVGSKSFDSKLFGANAVIEAVYPVYISPRVQLSLTGAAQLNLTLPQEEELNNNDVTFTQTNILDVLVGAVVLF